MAEKPRDAGVKFDTYRNVQLAASRGLPFLLPRDALVHSAVMLQ